MQYDKVVDTVNEVMGQYDFRLTVRQLYYRIISPPYQLFGNTINNYKGFDKILTKARERGDIDWRKIEDRSRSLLGGEERHDDTSADFLKTYLSYPSARWYSESWWKDQPKHVEVWVEKDALASLFLNAIKELEVHVYPNRGYSSHTKLMEALERFEEAGKHEVVILHYGDHDPSGVDMTRDLQERLSTYVMTEGYMLDITVKRLALTIEQVNQYRLESNPTKKLDARSAKYVAEFGNVCWELDAFPPDELARFVNQTVNREIDQEMKQASITRMEDHRRELKAALAKFSDEYEELTSKIIAEVEEDSEE